jgi:hypothetical protein
MRDAAQGDEQASTCNQNEAPEGYFAVPKASFDWRNGNICRECDWRPKCNDPRTDLLAFGQRCMSYAVVAVRDGQTYQRKDGCSVVFKLRPIIKNESTKVGA